MDRRDKKETELDGAKCRAVLENKKENITIKFLKAPYNWKNGKPHSRTATIKTAIATFERF